MIIDNIDPVAGEIAKTEGIANAEKGSGAQWQSDAVALIRRLATTHKYIVSDDLWASGLTEPGDSRALGAAFQTAKRIGYVAPSAHFVITHQASRHKAPVRVWWSKLANWDEEFHEENLVSRKARNT